MVAALGLWSRGWLSRLEALHAIEWGNYVAAIPLVRAAADYQASSLYVLRTDAVEWREWLEGGGIALSAEHHATEFRLHPFRAAEVLAAHDILGPVYRTTMDLSLSHFGSTLLVAGNESAPDRVLMTFGDRDFHLGLAELGLGWLLELGMAQVDALAEFDGVFARSRTDGGKAGVAKPRSSWPTVTGAGSTRSNVTARSATSCTTGAANRGARRNVCFSKPRLTGARCSMCTHATSSVLPCLRGTTAAGRGLWR